MTDEQASLIAAAVAVASAPRPLGLSLDDTELADRIAALARSLYLDLRATTREREHLNLVEQLASMSSAFEGAR